jgi:hypothetical protein
MRRPHLFPTVVLLTLSLTASLTPVYAQGTPAIFTGRVEAKDSKAPVPGAVIRLFRINSDRVYDTKTDKKGNFIRAGISPGKYRVVVECPGYDRLEIKSQEFMNNETLKVVLPLPTMQ